MRSRPPHRERGDDGAPDAVRTGVTAVFPGDGDPWGDPVYAGTHILNGYGELIGVNTIREWGILESPIVLTSSLLIGKAYDATVRWIAGRDPRSRRGRDAVRHRVRRLVALGRPLGPAVGRGRLGRARGRDAGPGRGGLRRIGDRDAGFDFKGGIGTASRVIGDEPAATRSACS